MIYTVFATILSFQNADNWNGAEKVDIVLSTHNHRGLQVLSMLALGKERVERAKALGEGCTVAASFSLKGRAYTDESGNTTYYSTLFLEEISKVKQEDLP